MKVEIVEAISVYDLEKLVNQILSKHHSSEIVDIKYSGNGNHSLHSRDYYSAMIIFQEADDHV